MSLVLHRLLGEETRGEGRRREERRGEETRGEGGRREERGGDERRGGGDERRGEETRGEGRRREDVYSRKTKVKVPRSQSQSTWRQFSLSGGKENAFEQID